MAKEQNNSNVGVFYNAVTQGTKITGRIEAEGDFRVDGEVEGDIICNGKVLIGQSALLNGNITCTNAEISGTVKGTLTISELLSLQSTSVVKGEIITKTLLIQPNAVFNGTCSIKTASDKQ
ncbi:MAG: polymer-forming cytoskeletal protein [Prevotellaceae bacterium]|jgi:cytoskeletal protein CcmA (bactofilin family)|nr:polymer-forming cytoskeletal protein [Prevotellaceae bacterium]